MEITERERKVRPNVWTKVTIEITSCRGGPWLWKGKHENIARETFLPTDKIVHWNFNDKWVHPLIIGVNNIRRKIFANKFVHKCHVEHMFCFDEDIYRLD